MSKRWFGWSAILFSFCVCTRAQAQCRAPETYVDTSRQQCGLAPRLDVQFDVQLGTAIGRACLQSGDDRACTSPGFPTLGAQLLVQLRLWRHVAIGPVLAYDQRVVSKTFGEGELRSDYSSALWRAMLELRWYSKSVAAGGLFIAMRTGAAWMTDSVLPLADVDGTTETQVAPVIGLSVGGVFAPRSGLGGTLALQSFIAPFPSRGPTFDRGFGRAHGYGSLLFVGVTAGVILGTGL